MTTAQNLTGAAGPAFAEPEELDAAHERLRACLREIGPVVVAFSGGADSGLLAWVANEVLGADALAVTAVSPSLPASEHQECAELASAWSLRWETVETHEMSDPRYVANDGDRCFWCKTALVDALEPAASAAGAAILLGVNLDDLGDHRPGQDAARQRGARFPLVETGFTKPMVRALSKRLDLATADKPAAACLASRIPYGTAVSIGVLQEVEAAEAALRQLGFEQLRVRHYRDLARVEVPLDRLQDVVDRREAVVEAVRSAGYRYVTLDLDGFRSGNLNRALGDGLDTI